MILPNFESEFQTIADFLGWWLRSPVLDAPHAATLKKYYSRYCRHFGAHIRHHYADQTSEIVNLIRQKDAPRLLEVGCGCGTEALWFALRGASVLAIDVSDKRLAVAHERRRIIEESLGRSLDIEFRYCSLFDLEQRENFDLIWMEQAFHHIEPRTNAYPAVAGLLKPEGRVVISEANGWNPLLQLLLLRRRGFQTIIDRTMANGERILIGNERITVPSALSRGFEKVGIAEEAVRYFRVLPSLAVADALLALERAIPSFVVPMFSHYNWVGRKLPRVSAASST